MLNELKQNYPRFGSFKLDENQNARLKSFIGSLYTTITSYNQAANSVKSNQDISEKCRKEKLAALRNDCQKILEQEATTYESRVESAQRMLTQAIRQKAPADSSEALLRHLQAAEIRSDLSKMPNAERVKVLQDSIANGSPEVLRAINSRPVTSKGLVSDEDLVRAENQWAKKAAPVAVENLKNAKSDAQQVRSMVAVAEMELK